MKDPWVGGEFLFEGGNGRGKRNYIFISKTKNICVAISAIRMLLYYPLHTSLSLLLLIFQPLFLIMHIFHVLVFSSITFSSVCFVTWPDCAICHEHRFTSFVWLSYLESLSSFLNIDYLPWAFSPELRFCVFRLKPWGHPPPLRSAHSYSLSPWDLQFYTPCVGELVR